jgi:autoinducer binding domain-containing protein
LDHEFIDFLTEIETAQSSDEVWKVWAKTCDNLGFNIINYAYAEENENGEVAASFIDNFNDDWNDYYLSENYQEHDYLLKYVQSNKVTPITHDIDRLDTSQFVNPITRQMLHEVSDLGFKRVLAIPLKDYRSNGFGGVAIATDILSTKEFHEVLTRKQTTLYAMAQLAHNHLKSSILEKYQSNYQSQLSSHQQAILQHLHKNEISPKQTLGLSALEDALSHSSDTKTNVNNQQQQIITVMNLALKLWSASTSTNRAELARRSGLWNVYFDRDGWERTQTLDRYLQLHTLPAYPRLQPVIRTAEYVLHHCSPSVIMRTRLQQALKQLLSSQ